MKGAARRGPELSPAKRRQILDGARRAFTEHGFQRTSVDEVAHLAGVSKATVYNHFSDKEALFVASCLDVSEQLRDRIAELLSAPSGQVELDLQRVGEHFLETVLEPAAVALHRIMVAEVGRLPELGQTLYDHVVCTMNQTMAAYLQRLSETGALQVDDPGFASRQFLALCQVDLAIQCQLGITARVPRDMIRTAVAQAVRTFLRAFRP